MKEFLILLREPDGRNQPHDPAFTETHQKHWNDWLSKLMAAGQLAGGQALTLNGRLLFPGGPENFNRAGTVALTQSEIEWHGALGQVTGLAVVELGERSRSRVDSHGRAHSIFLPCQSKEKVFRPNVGIATALGFLLGENQNAFSALAKSLEWIQIGPPRLL